MFAKSEVKNVRVSKIKKLYTIQEVADVTSIPVTAVRRWVKAGEIRSIKAGSRFYLTLDAIEVFINGAGMAR